MRIARIGCASIAAALALGAACSSSDDHAASPGDAGSAPDAPPADEHYSSDAWPPDPDPPPGLPEGWELDRSYWNQCGFYVPTSKDRLPPPPSWEPCPSGTEPAGVDCKLMVVGWQNAATGSKKGYSEAAWVNGRGNVVLGAVRVVTASFVIGEFVEADGPVRSAVLQTRTDYCGLVFPNIFADRYAWRVFEARLSEGGGVVASELDALRPRLAIHLAPLRDHDVYAAPFALLDLSAETFGQFSWTDAAPQAPLWSSSQDDNLQEGSPVFAGDAMFWSASNSLYAKVNVFTPATGVRDFLSAGLVFDHGFGDLGTDGKDLVWIEAQGRTSSSSSSPYQTLTIMTSPFTTEPSDVKPRRLRTEDGPGFGVSYFVLGCGYAARSNGYHVRLVRLSDGYSWILPTVNGAPVDWQNPLALTCTELFASVRSGGETRTARVRLDSLGPGMPPD